MPPEKFLADFLATLKAGVIRRSDFIPWADIAAKIRAFRPAIDFFEQMQPETLERNPREIADALLSADDPEEYVTLGFELLGHTGNTFVTLEDDADIHKVCEKIKGGNEDAAAWLTGAWKDLGLQNLLQGDVASSVLGVEVGLACNKRKNLGGSAFHALVGDMLLQTVKQLGLPDESLRTEAQIDFAEGRKKVDFAIETDGTLRVAFEVNFYTTSGSKPTEIKRAYADLNRNLDKIGITLVWITDGAGYRKMKKSLQDAFRVHPNTYNYNIATEHLVADLKSLGL